MMLSIVIVNYNTRELLRRCLESIYGGANGTPFEIWVVDNHSRDDSVAMVRSLFPRVRVIENPANVGFSRANNLVVAQSRSDYVLLLNPDTLILADAIERTVKFMRTHPHVGIAGCKVLNRDGTLQLACRRSIPTPEVAFYRMTGLSRLFPRSRVMARYNMTYQNPDETQEVDAVSGAFLMIRRQVIEQIGLLDEQFFMYGEELDWCLRTKQAGWSVMYYPEAQIVHYKGQSTQYNSRRAAFEFYRAMVLFHRKHFAGVCSPALNLLIYAGILCKASLALRQLVRPAASTADRTVAPGPPSRTSAMGTPPPPSGVSFRSQPRAAVPQERIEPFETDSKSRIPITEAPAPGRKLDTARADRAIRSKLQTAPP
ncbi:MAG: glycosyltransferase [Planctomycetes bacterium]|nr:glycosyltransferase [Planctomycetota bacterium]